jgi:hypothetical protein
MESSPGIPSWSAHSRRFLLSLPKVEDMWKICGRYVEDIDSPFQKIYFRIADVL